jgi:uncharacterized phage protein gp47/JayE
MSNFQKDFDTLFATILTDWQNQYPDADMSKGSLIYMKSACLASALWGLYKYQDWIARQIFPDTAETAAMEHHAWVRGLSRNIGETDAELLARLLTYIRRPPAGGNQYDYIKWALEIDYVAKAWCFPLAQGLGTVDVVILADEDTTGSELPSSHALTGTATSVTANKLVDSAANFADALPARIGDIAYNEDLATQAVVTAIDDANTLTLDTDIFTAIGQAYTLKSLTVQVKEYIDDVRPVTASVVRILPPTITTQAVTITVTGSGVDKTAIATEITAVMNALIPGETLYLSRIIASAIQLGAANVVVSLPVADVTPGAYEILRPGTITVN